MTELERLQAENEYLESGECCSKKLRGTPIEGGKKSKKKTEIVQGLVTEFSLDILLKIIKLARSTYYYHLNSWIKAIRMIKLKVKFKPFILSIKEITAIVDYSRIKKSWFQ